MWCVLVLYPANMASYLSLHVWLASQDLLLDSETVIYDVTNFDVIPLGSTAGGHGFRLHHRLSEALRKGMSRTLRVVLEAKPDGVACVPLEVRLSALSAAGCTACLPSCDGRQCGVDGCGNRCGQCDSDTTCGSSGVCGKSLNLQVFCFGAPV